MKKVFFSVASLVPAGMNGNFRLNNQHWLSGIDYSTLCAAIDVDEATNARIFVGAKLSAWKVEVPKEGITVTNPITQREITFKAHNSDEPVIRYIAWGVEALSERNDTLLLQSTIVTRKRGTTAMAVAAKPVEMGDEDMGEEATTTAQTAKPAANEPVEEVAAAPVAEADEDIVP